MFDEVMSHPDREQIMYKPTTWARVDEAVKPEPVEEDTMVSGVIKQEYKETSKTTGGLLSEMLSIVQYIRTFVAKNEEIIILAIVLIILVDGEDNIELLISLAILFYPEILGLFKK